MSGTFDEAGAKRIANVVRKEERDPRRRAPRGTAPRILQPIRNARTTTAVSARLGTTKGSGTITLYVDDQTGTGNMVSLQTGVKVWNVYGSIVPSGTWITVDFVDGLLQIQGADC